MTKYARAMQADNDVAFRAPPHNIECEQALLGAILLRNEALDRVSDFLKAEHFHDPLHRQIFETAATVIQSGRRVDPLTLRTFFENAPPVGDVPVSRYLGTLAANATTIQNAEHYGRTILELAHLRAFIVTFEGLVSVAYDSPADYAAADLLRDAGADLYKLEEGTAGRSGAVDRGSVVDELLREISDRLQNGGKLRGLETGISDLDDALGGLAPSELYILGGATSMGKSALGFQIGFHLARKGVAVAAFSLEMPAKKIYLREVAPHVEISAMDLERGNFPIARYPEVDAAVRELEKLPLHIDDTSELSVADLRSRARRMKREHNIGLVIVDYIQLLSGTSKRGSENRVLEVSEISRGLRALSRELKIPVLGLAQLNREVDTRDCKRPRLSDLREGGTIEQDADVVMFAYRDEYYAAKEEPTDEKKRDDWLARMEKSRGKAEIIIGKFRMGETGIVTLAFEGKGTRFSNLARGYQLRNGA
jgi:replicative DNA helicase